MFEETPERRKLALEFFKLHYGEMITEKLFSDMCDYIGVPKDWDIPRNFEPIPQWYVESRWLREIIKI